MQILLLSNARICSSPTKQPFACYPIPPSPTSWEPWGMAFGGVLVTPDLFFPGTQEKDIRTWQVKTWQCPLFLGNFISFSWINSPHISVIFWFISRILELILIFLQVFSLLFWCGNAEILTLPFWELCHFHVTEIQCLAPILKCKSFHAMPYTKYGPLSVLILPLKLLWKKCLFWRALLLFFQFILQSPQSTVCPHLFAQRHCSSRSPMSFMWPNSSQFSISILLSLFVRFYTDDHFLLELLTPFPCFGDPINTLQFPSCHWHLGESSKP